MEVVNIRHSEEICPICGRPASGKIVKIPEFGGIKTHDFHLSCLDLQIISSKTGKMIMQIYELKGGFYD